MAAKREKTKTQGIYRCGERYAFSYRVDGQQRWESRRTLDEARRARRARTADIDRGEFESRSRLTLREYALEWVERYQGRGRRGFRDHTREEYRRQLEQYVFRYFPKGAKLTEITPSKVAGFIAWLCDPAKQNGRALSDSTIRNIVKPLRACLASAVREGLIRSNPARDADMPHRPTAEGSEEEVRAMTRDELETLLALFPERWRLFFALLAATGLRISEAVALQWRHLELDGPVPHVKLRRALVKGSMGPLKSRYARREVPLSHSACAGTARAPQGYGVARGGGPRVRRIQWGMPGGREPASPDAQADPRGGVPGVGRIPHLPPHLRNAAVRGGTQRGTGAAVARPPLRGVHARHLRPPARRGHRASAGVPRA
jgi:hypothetical protein